MKQLSFIALTIMVFASCETANTTHPSVKYEEKKQSLVDMERDSPLKFLKVKGDFHRNLVNQTVVSGEIINHATLVSYKNMRLEIIFKDKEGAVIEKQKELLDQVIKPNSVEDFKVKLGHVKDASTVVVDIVDAAVADK